MGSESRRNPFNEWQRSEGVVTTRAYDRFGRELQEGDAVVLMGSDVIVWRISYVKPVLDAKAPPGLVEIGMQAVFVNGVPGGQKLGDIIKVRDVGEFLSKMPGDSGGKES